MVKLNHKRLAQEKAALDMQWEKAMHDVNQGIVDKDKLGWLMERLNFMDEFLKDQSRK